EIHLRAGTHHFAVTVDDIQICDSTATIVVAIWSHQRTALLFWWRIPVQFSGVDHATGHNFLPVRCQVTD
ncbi:MAG: hypothetical protein JRI68_28945, partial [Deltaproteobacteria bacterium]|nr:hypothetical protein [Deltaproteobacteria bacterium]